MRPDGIDVAVIGASGAVGQEILAVLAQRGFPVRSLRLMGSARSAGRKVPFMGREVAIEELTPQTSFAGVQVALVSAGAGVSRAVAPRLREAGTVMVDNSSAFRMDPDVPLVVPEVNAADALDAPRGIIANPNCTTIQMVVALAPIHRRWDVRRVHVATYQAASGAGAAAMEELQAQHRALCGGAAPREVPVSRFSHQLAYNLIPQIDVFCPGDDDYTREEMKMHRETKKIMHAPDLQVSAMCVRVPVMRAHSEAIWLSTARRADSLEDVRQALAGAPGVALMDDPAAGAYPMPLDAAGTDPVWVGRLRRDLADPNGLLMWAVGDQLRKGAALNAVQIAEYLFLQNH